MTGTGSRVTGGKQRALLVGAVVLAVCVAVGCFEFTLGYVGILVFSHVDTPDCASTDPFCVPGGTTGLTPRAALLLVMNGAAVLSLSLVLALRVLLPSARRI